MGEGNKEAKELFSMRNIFAPKVFRSTADHPQHARVGGSGPLCTALFKELLADRKYFAAKTLSLWLTPYGFLKFPHSLIPSPPSPGKLRPMSILVDKNTKVIVCGMTGREGGFHTQQMIEYGTQVVAGVTPGKGGTTHLGVPVFDTVEEATQATGANAALIFVPAPFAADSVLECEDAGLPFISLITEGLPIQDSVRIVNRVKGNGRSRLLGGNCAGIITPGECKMGIMPGHIFKPGPVGMVSRSGTLTYEIVWEMTRADFGQTTCVGIGGDPVPGTRFIEVLQMFEADPATKAVVMIGEIGGSDEEAAAEFIKQMTKPVVGFISGRTAPPGKRMGHAGAIISGNTGTAQSKVDALLSAGASVADKTSDVPRLLREAFAKVPAGV
jgi:succinyl-CoA synthetase alpha subunit